jgi:hypothetical protein
MYNHLFDNELFNLFISYLNRYIQIEYNRYWSKSDRKDFVECCNSEEIQMLIDVIMKITENKPKLEKETIYISVLYYYYSSIVLEYYATNFCPIEIFKKKYYKSMNINEVVALIKEITTSDEEWCSFVRRKINNLD